MSSILNLKKSKLRAQLLVLFFSHPEKEYYLRELERKVKKPAAYIRRELLGLEEGGLFTSEKRGKERYFRLNLAYPLFEEIKKIVAKTLGIDKKLEGLLKGLKNIEFAFIFGSYAEGKEDSLSDVDLMIIGTPDENRLLSEINPLEEGLGREINYHIYSRRDWIKKIKEKSLFIRNVLSKKTIFLVGDKNELPGIN